MSYSSYTSLGLALKALQIPFRQEPFVQPIPLIASAFLRQELEFAKERVNFTSSEFALCENIIYPMLKEVWRHYPEFQIWSHVPLNFNDELCGTPDYFLARSSRLGTPVIEEPYLLVVEAKKDDFDWGWGQCLPAMVAANKLNNWPEQVMFGICTTGSLWQFGKLQAGHLILDPRTFEWNQLDQVLAALNFMFDQCRQQLKVYAGAA